MTIPILSNISSYVVSLLSGSKSTFVNTGMYYSDSNMDPGRRIMFFLLLLILIYFTMFIGTWVFNTSIPNIVPSIKKISISDFFGLYIISHMLFCK